MWHCCKQQLRLHTLQHHPFLRLAPEFGHSLANPRLESHSHILVATLVAAVTLLCFWTPAERTEHRAHSPCLWGHL